jgi:uncharacterized repeat protein (TIGR01451 family)
MIMSRRWFALILPPLLVGVVILALPIANSGARSLSGLPEIAYPLDERGPNDFRVSWMGPDGDTRFFALDPAVVYNSTADEYLVVWAADGPLGDDEFEVYGQRVNAADGSLVGARFRVSHMGIDGDTGVYVRDPALAYNATADQYLVVWSADEAGSGLVDDEFEIYGQVLAANGAAVGSRFRVSNTGPTGDPDFDALNPAVAYNSVSAEYLVVWQGDGDSAPPVDNTVEIFGRRVSALGAPLGTSPFRISDMGTDGDVDFRAQDPALTHNATTNEYLVVWEGVDDAPGLAAGEVEIFGQRLAASGAESGANDFRISDMGPDGDASYAADHPALAWNSLDNTYLVVWSGDDGGELEVYGQRLDHGGTEIGVNDFRISHMGADGQSAYKTCGAEVAYVAARDHYLVVWRGDDDRDFGAGPLADNEMEIFGQVLDSSCIPVGADLRLSDAGPDGDPAYDADRPAVAAMQGGGGSALVVWQGEDYVGSAVEGEVEVFAQLYAVQLMPNVSLRKSAVPVSVVPGMSVTYTLAFTNTSSELATGVVLSDILPAEVTGVHYVTSGALLTQTNSGTLTFTWEVEDLAPAEAGTVFIHGTISPCLPGGYTFANAAAIFAAGDGYPGDNQDTAWLTVLNVAPVAREDGYATAQNQLLTVPATSGVLANDRDLNCDTLTAILDSGPAHGAIAFNLDGSFMYTPSVAFVGADMLTYHANDGLVDSNISTVTLAVGDDAPPEVTAVHPVDGAVDVAVDAGIIITFSEMLDTDTFSYTVAPELGGESLMWMDGDRVVIMEHWPFAYDTTYALTVTAAADLAGNPLVGMFPWSFSTPPVRLYMPVLVRNP